MKSLTTTPWSVPQSASRTIISWETSTKRRVKYPESAVFKAVSAEPLRAPCVDKKNSATLSPSIKFERIGISTGVPSGLAMIPRIPATWVKFEILPRALEFIMMKIGLSISVWETPSSSALTSSVALFHVSITLLNLSSSVIKPRLYCLLILSTTFWAASTILCLSLLISTSAILTVIPEIVEYLNPKSFKLSSIVDVSVVL